MSDNNNGNDVLLVQGRMTLGYGIIPKMAMQDRRLTPEAKAIYSYFCSFAGAGTGAFPSRDKILYDLQIGLKRYYKHFNLLKQYGYISVEQNIYSTEQFKNNIYTLIEMIPCSQNDHTVPCGRLAYTAEAYTPNDHIKNNSFKNNNLYNQQSKSSQSQTADPETEKSDMTLTNDIDTDTDTTTQSDFLEIKKELPQLATPTKANGLKSPSENISIVADYTTYRAIIQENVEYCYFLENQSNDIDLLDEIVNCILDVICTKSDTVKIGGEDKSRSMVISQYLKLNASDIEHVIGRYKEQRHKITHINSYLKTMLYTARLESRHYYTNAVRADGVVY